MHGLSLARVAVDETFWGFDADTLIVESATNSHPEIVSYRSTVFDGIAAGELIPPSGMTIDDRIGLDLVRAYSNRRDPDWILDHADIVAHIYVDDFDSDVQMWTALAVETYKGELDVSVIAIDREWRYHVNDPLDVRRAASLHTEGECVVALRVLPNGRLRLLTGHSSVFTIHDDYLRHGALPWGTLDDLRTRFE